jgi:hypothetical protein
MSFIRSMVIALAPFTASGGAVFAAQTSFSESPYRPFGARLGHRIPQ